jgi:hypothetical protein
MRHGPAGVEGVVAKRLDHGYYPHRHHRFKVSSVWVACAADGAFRGFEPFTGSTLGAVGVVDTVRSVLRLSFVDTAQRRVLAPRTPIQRPSRDCEPEP